MYELIGAFGALFWVFGILLFVFLGAMWPLMAWSAVRSLKGIHRELARMNAESAPAREPRRMMTGPLGV